MHLSRLLLASAVTAVVLSPAALAGPTTLFSSISDAAPQGIPSGGPYVPAGSLFDNAQSDGSTSLASQDSSGTFTARSADDFTLPAGNCDSGEFDVSLIRFQMVQADAAAQPFRLDIYQDNGSGSAPSTGINPIAAYPQTSQTALGPFGTGTSIFEVSVDTTGLTLLADTVYWISGYGANAAANSGGFNNFFAASAGAPGTTANGVIIAPGAGVANWTPIPDVIGGSPLAFSFAIDGECRAAGPGPTVEPVVAQVPANSHYSLALLSLLLGAVAWFGLKRKA